MNRAYLRDWATMFSHIVRQWVTLSFLVVACSFFLEKTMEVVRGNYRENGVYIRFED